MTTPEIERMFNPRYRTRPRLRDRLRVAWKNWRVRGTGKAYRALTQAMRDHPDYAHSWQCNIAIPIFEGARGKLTLDEANVIADRLMTHLFLQDNQKGTP